jgi:hypothetical protein
MRRQGGALAAATPSATALRLHTAQGHASYASVLYAMLAFMAATVGACVWVSHAFIKKGVVPNKW